MKKCSPWLLIMILLVPLLSGCRGFGLTPTPDYSDYACADGAAGATAWNDLNGNGGKEPNEAGLPGVCMYAYYVDDPPTALPVSCAVPTPGSDKELGESLLTDADGNWMDIAIAYGGCGTMAEIATQTAEQCPQIIIVAFPPVGYRATTPTTIHNCSADFGFVKLPAVAPNPTGSQSP